MLGGFISIKKPSIKVEYRWSHASTYNLHCVDPCGGAMAHFDFETQGHTFLFEKYGDLKASRIVSDFDGNGKTILRLEVSPSHGDTSFKEYDFGFLRDFTGTIFKDNYLPFMDNIVNRLVIFCIFLLCLVS